MGIACGVWVLHVYPASGADAKKWGSQPVVGYGMLICGVVYSCIVKVWTIPVHLDSMEY